VFGWIRRFVAEVRRAREAGRFLKMAQRLYSEGRYAEAAEVLKVVSVVADHPGGNSMAGVHHATRLRVATLLSMTAARLGDTALALDAIEEGLRLWDAIKGHMRKGETVQRMEEWEAWAKGYTAATTGE
jgi:hypothetical protein